MYRNCFNCNSDTTFIDKRGYGHWYKHDENWYCEKCDNKLFKNPKWTPITHPIWNARHLGFKGKIIHVKENPRKGICYRCGAIKGINCRRTSIHHIQYHEDDPLKDTIELCNKCHKTIHLMLLQ